MTPDKSICAVFLATAFSCVTSTYGQIHAFDYETPAYVDFEFSEVVAHEDEPVVVVNIYRTGDFRQLTRVDFVTEEISATEGKDYRGTGGTITFRPGEGFKRIEIPIISDDEAETNETFRVRLTRPSANTLLMREESTVVIQDTVRPISPPTLEVAMNGDGNISLSWEGDPTWQLERSADLAHTQWETVHCNPTRTEKGCEVVEPAFGTVYLYRLRIP